jgi:hypothetical protein
MRVVIAYLSKSIAAFAVFVLQMVATAAKKTNVVIVLVRPSDQPCTLPSVQNTGSAACSKYRFECG